jgi:hypothetical protein
VDFAVDGDARGVGTDRTYFDLVPPCVDRLQFRVADLRFGRLGAEFVFPPVSFRPSPATSSKAQ